MLKKNNNKNYQNTLQISKQNNFYLREVILYAKIITI